MQDRRLRAENFRPGTMAQMGFGYDQLRELKPDIILISVSGVRAIRPLPRAPGLRPARPGDERADVADRRAGRHAARRGHLDGRPLHLAACDDRHAGRAAPSRPTGEGQLVDVCLMDSALTMVEIPTCYYLATGEEGGEAGRPPFKAKDGHVVISASGSAMATAPDADRDRQQGGRRRGLDQPGRPRRRAAQGGRGVVRREHRRPYRQDPARRRDPGRAGQDDPQVAEDPHLWEREMLVKMEDPVAGEMYLPGADDQVVEDPGPRRPGPDPGPAHRRGALAALGYDRATLEDLRQAKVIA